jgi:hypothetical protein
MNDWKACDGEIFPENFPDVGGKTFNWVRLNRKEFCEFVVREMKECTGIFLAFQKYLLKQE